MKIVGISGSLRKDSYNTNLLKFMKERYKDKIDIEILNISELPFYSQSIEDYSLDSVKELREKIVDADGIIFATPEHNNTIPAALKNFIDWMSRVEFVMVDKPGMIVGASPGKLGTSNAQRHLKEILDSPYVGVRVVPSNSVLIGSVHELIDENNRLIDQETIKFLDSSVDKFIEWIDRVK